jgi:hypothetical protein
MIAPIMKSIKRSIPERLRRDTGSMMVAGDAEAESRILNPVADNKRRAEQSRKSTDAVLGRSGTWKAEK